MVHLPNCCRIPPHPFTAAVNSSQCHMCPPGTFAPWVSLVLRKSGIMLYTCCSCLMFLKWRLTVLSLHVPRLQPQSPICQPCQPGKFAYSWGSAYCKNCIEGTYAPEGGRAGTLFGWGVHCLAGWLAGWPAAWLAGWQDGWLITWLTDKFLVGGKARQMAAVCLLANKICLPVAAAEKCSCSQPKGSVCGLRFALALASIGCLAVQSCMQLRLPGHTDLTTPLRLPPYLPAMQPAPHCA